MPTLDEIRQKYPQYHDMSDDVLANKLHAKFYADMPRTEFDQKVGYKKDYSFAEIPRAAIEHAPGSAVRLAKDIAQPFIHPMETLQSFKDLGTGILQKLNVVGGHEQEKYADAVGKYFVDRYGSVQAVKNALATDPAGILADASIVLSGGETALARAPGLVGKVGEVAGSVGRAIDPVTAAGRTVKGATKLGSEAVGGLLTGTGGKAINEAFMAGAKALAEPEYGKTFREHFTGRVDPAEAVTMAQGALSNMIKERGSEYKAAMTGMSQAHTKPLNFDRIDDAVRNTFAIGTYGGVVVNASTNAVRQAILEKLMLWKSLPPDKFHTAEGLDALKKSIKDIRDEPGNRDNFGRLTAPGILAEDVARAIEKTITKEAPEYARIMKGYSEASDIINNLQRELSLGRTANVDTGLKKLQSVLRNNVTSNYGRREVLAQMLVDSGATTLMAALAGQSLSTLIPRGLAARLLAAGEAFFGASHGAGGESLLKAAGALTLSSPLIVGGLAHGAGVLASPIYGAAKVGEKYGVTPRRVGRGAYAAGRVSEPAAEGITTDPNTGRPRINVYRKPEPVAEPGP